MKISTLNKYAPHILKFARENLSKFNYGSHPIDEEIETVNVEYLIAYAYREKVGIGIPDCIALLGDYKRLKNAIEFEKTPYPKTEQKEDERIEKALGLIFEWGGIDGAHHKQWLIDQVVIALAPDYDAWVSKFKDGEDGKDTYEWDKGIAP